MVDIHKASALSPALPVGTMLGNYNIRKVIGSGSFGITYLAQEEITDKLIVIKENYPAEISFRDMTSLMVGPSGESRKEAYEWALTRFLDEAKILSRLSHPNIVPILAAFKALGTAYYVMPHVEGTELHKAAPDSRNITAEWLLPVLEKILSALGYLHAQGLIHRDIKPNNILMNATGEPILIDFGTARALESTRSHTHIGTPGFMPFEQLSGKGKRGPWTDFYALGATCYYLITGELPPHSVDRIEKDEYLPLAGNPSLANRFPEHVLSSIDKALRMNRSERWQSAQEWLNSLKSTPSSQSGESSKNIQHQLTTSPKSTQLTTKPHTSSSKKKSYTLSLIFFLLLAGLIYGGFCYQQPAAELKRMGINPEQYNSELYAAARDGDAEKVRLLLEAGADVNWKNDTDHDVTPLFCAAHKDHTECVRLLLAAPGIDINQAAQNGYTPLIVAVGMGHTECVRLLLAAPGIDINQAAQDGDTPLNWAAYNGHTECVNLLLAAPGIDVNQTDMFGETPLNRAAQKGHKECVRLLLTAPGININQASQRGSTPLSWAAYNGHTECVRLLLAAPGIDINKASSNGTTPLSAATDKGHTECANLIRTTSSAAELKRMGINPEQYNSSLYAAARDGDAEKVKLLIAAEADVNWKNDADNGETPLYWAAYNGHTECVRLLLAAPGIDVNQANQYGNTPLIHAAASGHTECVRLLLAAPGIDINKADNAGWTPLRVAEAYWKTECARLIREAGGR